MKSDLTELFAFRTYGVSKFGQALKSWRSNSKKYVSGIFYMYNSDLKAEIRYHIAIVIKNFIEDIQNDQTFDSKL